MRPINLIVIHCSASPNGDSLFRGSPGTPGLQTPVATLDAWHQQRGFHRDAAARQAFNPALAAIGYHFVVYTSGVVVTGRSQEEIGAHVTGFNQKSLGICMIGTDKFTAAQWYALRELVTELRGKFPDAKVVGHRDLSPDQNKNGIVEKFEWLKICPGFDVATWLQGGMAALSDHQLSI